MTGLDKTRQSEEKARQYFGRPGFRRMLSLVWGKYAVLGRVGGQVTIKLAREGECEAINEFFGTYYKPQESISLRLEEFQQELLDSAFPYTIPELHQIIEGGLLLTKLEKSIIREEKWKQLFRSVEDLISCSDVFITNWLLQLEEGIAPGYRTLLEQFRVDPEQAKIALQHTVTSLDMLLVGSAVASGATSLGPFTRLPFLAVIATGDSHALDWKRPAGRLLYYALRERRFSGMANNRNFAIEEESLIEEGPLIEEEYAVDTLTIREVYRSAGISDDDLSAIVHVYRPESGTPPVPTVWTLREIEAMEQVPIVSALYIVENPPVFSMLLDAMNELICGDNQASVIPKPPMLVCSSGPASAAALRLLRRIMENSTDPCPIFYSGDFDVKGLEMGVVLANRFPEQFSPWRFDAHTYVEPVLPCPNGPDFSQAELNRLFQLKVPWDAKLTLAMHRKGHRVFQETLISVLIEDWVKVVVSGDDWNE